LRIRRRYRFSATGVSLGDDETVLPDALASQDFDVAALPGGWSVVVFLSSSGTFDAYGRLLQPDGTGFGFSFPLDESSANSRSQVQVDSDDAGNFVVSWFDTTTDHIFARVFAADATALTAPLQVTTSALTHFPLVRLGVGPEGGFVLSWTKQLDGDDPMDIWVREYGGTGLPVGPPVLVEGTGEPQLGGVAMSAARFLPIWQAADGSLSGIWGRHYLRRGIFAEGFENGATEHWSATLP
jgi:hypothetical protein